MSEDRLCKNCVRCGYPLDPDQSSDFCLSCRESACRIIGHEWMQGAFYDEFICRNCGRIGESGVVEKR